LGVFVIFATEIRAGVFHIFGSFPSVPLPVTIGTILFVASGILGAFDKRFAKLYLAVGCGFLMLVVGTFA
jgi:hypothetical protein